MNDDRMKRRAVLKGLFGVGVATAGASVAAPLKYFKPLQIDNPLAAYPNRDWEKAYRNIFNYDSSFVFLCAPNDTHNCLLRAYVKNGVVTRIGPTYGYSKAEDSMGHRASGRWDPRICQKGLALVRRIYGDRRVKAPMVRKGFKDWVDSGMPRDPVTGVIDPKFLQRGKDAWVRVSWDEANTYSAKALENIIRTYSGPTGHQRLTAQGYDPAMVEATHGAGVQTVKVRGGMAFLGATRIFGLYRFSNLLALADSHVRGVKPEDAHGGRGWDSYSWHTDLPPGHPMVTGSQTNDFELFSTEHANLILVWGMNWITTKMPDSHWLTEARLKGAKVTAITVEYSATASKSDDVVVLRPGTDPAFALGLAQQIIAHKRYDSRWVCANTDLPFLVRMDTLQPLRPEQVIERYVAPELKQTQVLKTGEKPTVVTEQHAQNISEALAGELAAHVVFDAKTKRLAAVTRDDWGPHFKFEPNLSFSKKVKLVDGSEVEVRTGFEMLREYLDNNLTPAQCEAICGAPAKAITRLAEEIAKNPEKTLFVNGMGPNQFFNADLKDRAIFLVAALTRNVGFAGGNVGSYSGNYRSALFGGMPLYAAEDPFNLQLDPAARPTVKKYMHYESLHYFNYGDRPLRAGTELVTGEGHLPTPTKAMWLNNSNSVIGNAKWHYDVVHNTLPRVEFVAFADWWWTASCEYADVVFACDSWAEFKNPDMTASSTNPFLQLYPVTPLRRIFDTRSDLQIIAGVSKALGAIFKDQRFADAWKFVDEDKVEVYLQRIIDGSAATRGYLFGELMGKAAQGIPALMNNRTYPRISSYEQARGEQSWHTKSGRLEFYRPEKEFIEQGANLVVHREPIDATFHEPNAILAEPHEGLRPRRPESYGLDPSDQSTEVRQVRNVMLGGAALMKSQHPLTSKGFTHIYHTPKYRHGAHTTPVDTDFTGVLFGPFGDVYRHDKRMPSNTEGYVDLNPLDAQVLRVADGDYLWVDADPTDRPFRKPVAGSDAARLSRLLLRVRFYPGTPRGVARTWHNMYGATFGSMKGHETRSDGLARNPETQYQAMYRYGSHQSATRAWLKPTLMTETLLHKGMFGQTLVVGFEADIHCPVGAPREAFVKLTAAEAGGLGGKGRWRPYELGLRPTVENEAMKQYIGGAFIFRR